MCLPQVWSHPPSGSTPGHVRKPVHVVQDSDSDEYVAFVDVKELVCGVEKSYSQKTNYLQ